MKKYTYIIQLVNPNSLSIHHQVEKLFQANDLQGLSESLKSKGMLQRMIIYKGQVIVGQRRLKACMALTEEERRQSGLWEVEVDEITNLEEEELAEFILESNSEDRKLTNWEAYRIAKQLKSLWQKNPGHRSDLKSPKKDGKSSEKDQSNQTMNQIAAFLNGKRGQNLNHVWNPTKIKSLIKIGDADQGLLDDIDKGKLTIHLALQVVQTELTRKEALEKRRNKSKTRNKPNKNKPKPDAPEDDEPETEDSTDDEPRADETTEDADSTTPGRSTIDAPSGSASTEVESTADASTEDEPTDDTDNSPPGNPTFDEPTADDNTDDFSAKESSPPDLQNTIGKEKDVPQKYMCQCPGCKSTFDATQYPVDPNTPTNIIKRSPLPPPQGFNTNNPTGFPTNPL